eukprot:scaffold75759_cov21-Tisochrysis_lutea.AAC.1
MPGTNIKYCSKALACGQERAGVRCLPPTVHQKHTANCEVSRTLAGEPKNALDVVPSMRLCVLCVCMPSIHECPTIQHALTCATNMSHAAQLAPAAVSLALDIWLGNAPVRQNH